jgi:hypothetical protein
MRIRALAAAALLASGIIAATGSQAQAAGACVDPLSYHLFGASAYGAEWAEDSYVWASDSLSCKYNGEHYRWVAWGSTTYLGRVNFTLPRPR